MSDNKFLDLYNEELYYLREVGKEFAYDNPQVAKYLGMHSDGIQDPFVERLLEGTAFLAARVQEKLSNEQSEVAVQMLSRLAPLWYTPTPSMSVISFEPDLSFPQWNDEMIFPRGSQVIMEDKSLRNEPVIFTTSRDVVIQPVVIDRANCSAVPPDYLSESVVNYFNDSLSYISVRFDTKYTLPISALKLNPFILTMAGDSVRVNQILHSICTDSLRVLLWSKEESRIIHEVLEPSVVELASVTEEESLLPVSIGELPGSRILKEYLNLPGKFFSLKINGMEDFFKKCDKNHNFEIFFILKNRYLNLLDNVHKEHFRLFSTPIINLYRKRCDPVLLDNMKFENPIIVDRHNPTLYKVHHLAEVSGLSLSGKSVHFSPLQMEANYDDQSNLLAYSVRRRTSKLSISKYKNEDLSHEDLFITLSPGKTGVDLDNLSSLSVVAYVCQRHLNPRLLQNPTFSLQKSLPILKIEMLYSPSRPVDIPDMDIAWNALQIISSNPFKYTYPKVKNNNEIIKSWISLFSNPKDAVQRNRISSIENIVFRHCYTRHYGAGPIAWARAVEAELNILSKNHSDKGAFIFGRILYFALLNYCELNQKLIMKFSIDDNEVSKWE